MADGTLYTTHQVAALFGVTTATVRVWVAEHRITSVRTPKGRIRIPESEIDKLTEERT